MRTKVIVHGLVPDHEKSRCFWCLNGDIELDADGREIYIESQRIIGSSEMEDRSIAVSDLPLPLQEYIKTHKETIFVPDGEDSK